MFYLKRSKIKNKFKHLWQNKYTIFETLNAPSSFLPSSYRLNQEIATHLLLKDSLPLKDHYNIDVPIFIMSENRFIPLK